MSEPRQEGADPHEPAELAQDKEAQFLTWLAHENQRREGQRLRQRILLLTQGQLLSILLAWFWIAVAFCGFRLRPEIMPADIAGFITMIMFFGGGFIVWHLRRLQREAEARLAMIEASDQDPYQPAPPLAARDQPES